MSPRIALCISGALRNFKDTFYSFEEMILSRHDIDVFFYGAENCEGAEQNEKDLIALFKPKKYTINKSSFYNTTTFSHASLRPSPTLYYSFFNILKCNELKIQFEQENNFEYDLVIRCRADHFWFRPITTEEIELAKNYILFPWEWSFNCVSNFALCDMFAFGTSNRMNLYSTAYNHIDEYCKKIKYHPESIIGYHVHKNNIPFKEISRHVIYEYPSPRVEKYISPYKFTKYFDEPDIVDENEFLHVVSNKRKNF